MGRRAGLARIAEFLRYGDEALVTHALDMAERIAATEDLRHGVADVCAEYDARVEECEQYSDPTVTTEGRWFIQLRRWTRAIAKRVTRTEAIQDARMTVVLALVQALDRMGSETYRETAPVRPRRLPPPPVLRFIARTTPRNAPPAPGPFAAADGFALA